MKNGSRFPQKERSVVPAALSDDAVKWAGPVSSPYREEEEGREEEGRCNECARGMHTRGWRSSEGSEEVRF